MTRLVAFIALSFLIATRLVGAQPAAPLVINGDFEGKFADGVAEGWKAWADPWGEREYHDETAAPHSGEHAQGWTAEQSCSGIYQVVKGADVGQAYRLTAWIMYQTPGAMWAECGFDPSGGTDQSEVYWTKLETIGPAGMWLKYERNLLAEGEAVSVWFKWGTTSGSECKGLADDVSLVPVADAQIEWCSVAGRAWAAGGGPLPNVSLTSRPGRRTATTGGDGVFSFARMYADRYQFTATKPGYAPDTIREIAVTPQAPAQFDISLTPIDYLAGGDFESAFIEGIPSYWTPWWEGGAVPESSRSTDVRHRGDAAFEWRAPARRSGLRQVVVGLEQGVAYALSAWLRADAGAKVGCGYDPAGGSDVAQVTWLPEPAPDAHGWRHYQAQVTPQQDRISVWIVASGGRAWADDISLVRHDPDLR